MQQQQGTDVEEFRKSHQLLNGLFHYLVRSYPDDQWDGTTREFLQETAAHLGEPPLVFQEETEG